MSAPNAEHAAQLTLLASAAKHLAGSLRAMTPDDHRAMATAVIETRPDAQARPDAGRLMRGLSECARAASKTTSDPERLTAVAEAAAGVEDEIAAASADALGLMLQLGDLSADRQDVLGYVEVIAKGAETAAARLRPRAH